MQVRRVGQEELRLRAVSSIQTSHRYSPGRDRCAPAKDRGTAGEVDCVGCGDTGFVGEEEDAVCSCISRQVCRRVFQHGTEPGSFVRWPELEYKCERDVAVSALIRTLDPAGQRVLRCIQHGLEWTQSGLAKRQFYHLKYKLEARLGDMFIQRGLWPVSVYMQSYVRPGYWRPSHNFWRQSAKES